MIGEASGSDAYNGRDMMLESKSILEQTDDF
jgi:hypothetical protein